MWMEERDVGLSLCLQHGVLRFVCPQVPGDRRQNGGADLANQDGGPHCWHAPQGPKNETLWRDRQVIVAQTHHQTRSEKRLFFISPVPIHSPKFQDYNILKSTGLTQKTGK